MWKPGTKRPSKGSNAKNSATPPGTKTPTTLADGLNGSKSPPAVKKLSSGTMNMRFMQRTSISPKQLRQKKSSATPVDNKDVMECRHDDDNHNTNDDRMDDGSSLSCENNNNNEYVPPFLTATAQDMYGPVVMGRRSFGGTRPAVEHMYQQSANSVNEASRKRKRDKK